MGKLSHIQAALNSRPAPVIDMAAIRDQIASMVAMALQDVRIQVAGIVNQEVGAILNAATESTGRIASESGKSAGSAVQASVKAVNARLDALSGEMNAAISKVVEAHKASRDEIRAAVAAESGATRRAIPKAEKVDLSAVLADLQWLKTVVALEKPEVEPPKKEWTFHVERDSHGYIKQIRAE